LPKKRRTPIILVDPQGGRSKTRQHNSFQPGLVLWRFPPGGWDCRSPVHGLALVSALRDPGQERGPHLEGTLMRHIPLPSPLGPLTANALLRLQSCGPGTKKKILRACKAFTNLVTVTKLYYPFYGSVTKV